ncbi:hypothetical protein D9M70_528120 [compost metagenome]
MVPAFKGFDHRRLTIDDAKVLARSAQRTDHCRVRHHMGEGPAIAAVAIEGQKHRAHRIGRLRIGNHHAADRLRLRHDLIPDAKHVEHAFGSRRNRRGALVLLPGAFRRAVDHHDAEMRRRLFQG